MQHLPSNVQERKIKGRARFSTSLLNARLELGSFELQPPLLAPLALTGNTIRPSTIHLYTRAIF